MNRIVEANVYMQYVMLHITNSKQIFLTEPKEQNIEEIDYKGTFAKGSRIYARVLWEPKQDLKVSLCPMNPVQSKSTKMT